MKNKGLIITLISIFSILSIALVALMIALITGSVKFSNFNYRMKVSNELVMDKYYDTFFEKVIIEADTSDVYVKYSSGEKVRVVVYGVKERLSIDDDKNELFIKSQGKTCTFFCFGVTMDKIEIYLPANFDKTILINNNYGDVKIDKFSNADIELMASCGDVSIAGGNKITVNNDFGNIKIGEANEISIHESAGDVEVGRTSIATIENDYGDIEIGEVFGYLDITDSCGDIEIDSINLNKDSKITNNLGDIEIGSTNDIYIDAKVDLGDIQIKNNSRKSDITLEIKNDCGNITVNN